MARAAGFFFFGRARRRDMGAGEGMSPAVQALAALVTIFSVAALLGRSRGTVAAGSLVFGAGVWVLHGAVSPQHQGLVLPGILLWPVMAPACAAALWWLRASPQPPRWVGAAWVFLAVALALAGGLSAWLLGG